MAKTFVRISLATKFRVLFAAAVVAILAAALGVPWYFAERLTDEAAQEAAEQVARLGLHEWQQRHPQQLRHESSIARFFTAEGQGRRGPKFVPLLPTPATGPTSNPVTLLELDDPSHRAVKAFRRDDDRTLVMLADQDDSGNRVYRCLYAVRATNDCRLCHDGQSAQAYQPGQLVGLMDLTVPPATGLLIWWTRGVFLLGGVLAAGLAFVVFSIITNQIILSPVRRLRDLADKVAEGDLSQRCDIATGDEFERLGKRFNEMLDAIKTQQDQLRQANRALDARLGEVAQANVALYETNRIKNEFLANVSHELRTPLNSIIGFAELLGETDDEKRRRQAHHVLTAARTLLGIINDLLDLAKIEAGRVEVRWEKVAVNDLCQTMAQLVGPLAAKKRLELSVQLAENIPLLRTDPGKVQQILYNLLSNAIKFTPSDGKVVLRSVLAPPAEGAPAGEAVVLSVQDTGPGIPAADQQRIFEKFQRIDNALTREYAGAGLGLSISRELALLLGGKLTLQSEPGHGATFTLLLPLNPPTEGKPSP